MLRGSKKRSQSHGRPISNKMKRILMDERRKRKKYRVFLERTVQGETGESKGTTMEKLRQQKKEATLSRGKKGSHRKV